MKYLPLLSLDLEHSYYTDGSCPDFVIEPSAETKRLVKSHRGILKQTGSRTQLLVPVDESGAPHIELHQDTDFVLHLRLVNPSFMAFTDLSSLERLPAPVFTNGANEIGSVELTPSSLSRYTKLPTGVFAIAAIKHHSVNGPLPSEPSRYRIRFAAKSAHWSYYCVTHMPGENNDLAIVDLDSRDSDQQLRFGPTNRSEIGREPVVSDRVAAELVARFPDLRLVRFVSDRAVACREAPRRRLELQLNGERLVGPLPNPSWRDFTALPATNGEREAFYHVVTQLARPRTKNGG